MSAPTVLWEATTAYVDLALGLHAGLALYALLRFAESESRSWFLLAALQMGLALATKHLAFIALLPLTAGLGIFLLRRRGPGRAVGLAALFVGMSLLVAFPWYARSWLASGNPVFPEFHGIFGAPPDRWDALTDAGLGRFKESFGRPRTFLNLLSLPWDATVHAARYGGTLGPLFLLLLPALVPGRPTAPARGSGWGCSPIRALGVACQQLPDAVPRAGRDAFGGLGAVAYGRLRSLRPGTGSGPGGWLLKGGVPLLVLLNLPPAIPLHEADREGWNGWLTHVVRGVPAGVVSGAVSADRYLSRTVRSYEAWRYINAHLSRDARILSFTNGDNLYGDRERLWAYATVARPAVWGAPAGSEERALGNFAACGSRTSCWTGRSRKPFRRGASPSSGRTSGETADPGA